MAGTGLSDILLEAGLIGSGSVTGVITGKHYSRAMHCHKILLEASQQLRGEIIRAPNTTKKFSELLFVFFIGKEGLPV
jgi:hypothetical protein